MQKLLTAIAIALTLSTPARALITEDAIVEDNLRPTANRINGKLFTGTCVTNPGTADIECSKAIIIGLDRKVKNLNFYFINENGTGVVYVTKTKSVDGVYSVVAWGLVTAYQVGEISAPVGRISACSIGSRKAKVVCMTKDEDAGFLSVVFR